MSIRIHLGFIAAAWLAMLPVHAQVPDDPNVLLIICDDLNDFQGIFGGHPQAQTPNIDNLASNGVQFVNAHSAAPICGPSRSSFMTGIYPHTSNNYAFENWYNPGKSGFAVNPVLENSKTLMRYMRDNGYTSYRTGKIMHFDLNDNYVYPAGHPEAGNLQQDWDDTGDSAWAGPMAFDPNANGGAGEAVNHPMIPVTFYEGAGALNSLFGSLTNVPNVNGYTGWWNATWKSAGAFNYVDDSNRDDMQDEKVRKWAVNRINALAASDPTGENEKFFMAVGFHNPHTPLVAPQQYFDLYPLETLQLPPRIADDVDDTYFNKNLPPNTSTLKVYSSMVDSIGEAAPDGTTYATEEDFLKAYLQAYLACVSFVDEQVGALVDALDASPYASNTVVILTSDHGYEWGEKEALSKNTLWENSTRVPLVIRVPGLESNANRQVTAPVGLIDLYPTVRDLCGLTADTKKNPQGADLDGHSLRPFLEDPENGQWDGPSVALSEVSGNNSDDEASKNFAVRSENWRYIRYESGAEELYNLAVDPYEFTNLADSADSAVQARRTELQNELFAFLPALATEPSGLLTDPYFAWLGDASHPDPGTAPWFTIDEANDWSFRRDNANAHKGSYSLWFNQKWNIGSVAQNLDLQLDTNTTYTCSFWMRSFTQSQPGVNPTTINIELATAADYGGPYTNRADIVAGAQNTVLDTWEQHSGSLDASALGAYQDEYIQFRITKPNGNTVYLMNVDDLVFDAAGNGSFAQWALGEGISRTTPGYDLDQDGLVNLEEFARGGDPADPASTGYASSLEQSGAGLHYVYPRRKDARLHYWIETNTNLAADAWTDSGYAERPVTGMIDADFEAVTNDISTASDQAFIRLRFSEE
jgi:arylsulfatase A-like enzyme